MATLHLMVGLPCAGKTTLAKRLEAERAALRLTPDEWHLPLFGDDIGDLEHDRRHDAIESLLWSLGSRALTLGVDVILDFGFWSREEREAFRDQAASLGAASEIHFLDVSEQELLRRLDVRNGRPGEWDIPLREMRRWMDHFEPPAPDELLRREPPTG